jgi:hypothetical protein
MPYLSMTLDDPWPIYIHCLIMFWPNKKKMVALSKIMVALSFEAMYNDEAV